MPGPHEQPLSAKTPALPTVEIVKIWVLIVHHVSFAKRYATSCEQSSPEVHLRAVDEPKI